MMDEKRLKVVKEMEARMETLNSLYERASLMLEELANAEAEHRALETYYYGDWSKDYDAANRGEVPEDVSCGVLTEDLPYETLCTHDQLGRELLHAAHTMLYRD